MITHTDKASIQRYRDRLGKELYDQLMAAWEESESYPGGAEGELPDSSDDTAMTPRPDTGDCPVCGHPAAMATLREVEGEGYGSPRQLWCAHCENVWDFERIRCTRCGTRTQAALSYHFDEGDMARRIYFCKLCDGTQKTLSEKDLKEDCQLVDLRLESLLMEPLEQAVAQHCLAKKIAESN
ncbi:MAG: formate dehydrogenase accessory protein FdhE [Coriobacteriia bacterium]|nr:formate dehydrogenase accessory protein FdhE [Coriobacteriia bacterium]